MEWWNEYNSGFFISVLTITVGALTLCFKSCLASKCSRTKICYGCLDIERDTHAEEDIEMAKLNRIPFPSGEEDSVV